jgi:hypothetical protein
MTATNQNNHDRNLAEFERLMAFYRCNGLHYRPARTTMALPVLQDQYTSARTSLQLAQKAKAIFEQAALQRANAFAPLNKLVSQVVATLAACRGNADILNDARLIYRKLRMERILFFLRRRPGPLPGGQGRHISRTQHLYDTQLAYFNLLISLLEKEDAYMPYDPEQSLAGLRSLACLLQRANNNVIDRYSAWNNARVSCDQQLYDPMIGLVQIALDLKQYFKTIYSPASPQYKQLRGMNFKQLRTII